MAACKICNKDMLKAKGCTPYALILGGLLRQRIKRNEKGDPMCGYPHENIPRCHDCGCLDGEYHHLGCDMEACPVCGGQLFICDCKFLIRYRDII